MDYRRCEQEGTFTICRWISGSDVNTGSKELDIGFEGMRMFVLVVVAVLGHAFFCWKYVHPISFYVVFSTIMFFEGDLRIYQ